MHIHTSTSKTSKHILLVAYAFSTKHGSEPGAGWSMCRAHLSLDNHVTLLTRSNQISANEIELKYYIDKKQLKIIRIDDIRFHNLAKHIPFHIQILHFFWQIKISKFIKSFLNTNSAILHYVTYAGDWNFNVSHFIESPVLNLWGPVGGAQRIPNILLRNLPLKGQFEEMIRIKIGSIFRSLIKLKIRKIQQYKVLALNEVTFNYFNDVCETYLCHSFIFPEFDLETVSDSSKEGYFLIAGRLISLKNVGIAIDALSEVEGKKLVIVGDGPELRNLKKLAKLNKIEDRVIFLGNVNREQVFSLMRKSEAFIFTSLRDSYSWALAEAIHLEVGVIALNLPGNRALIEDQKKLVSIEGDLIENLASEMRKNTHPRFDQKYCVCKVAEKLALAIEHSSTR